MNSNLVKVSTALAIGALSACVGSNGIYEIQPIEAMLFSDVEANSQALFEANAEDFFNSEFTPVSQLPSGEANYSGYLAIGPAELSTGEEEADVVGQLNINVDFGASDGQIQGEASNFFAAGDGAVIDGSLMLDASIVDTTGQLDGNISGTLMDANGDDAIFNVNVSGGFLGDDAGVIAGSGVGTVTIPNVNDVDQIGIIFGAE